jgi:hypothetical protein
MVRKVRSVKEREPGESIWRGLHVELQVINELAAGLPKTPEEIVGMLDRRKPGKKPEGAKSLADLAVQVADEVGLGELEEEEKLPGWATFKRDAERGLYFEGRAVRGHIKDAAQQIVGLFDVAAFKSKVANKVYVMTDRIYLGKMEPDGTIQRFIQAITPKGPRSTIKYIDYVVAPRLSFDLKVLDDGVIQDRHLRTIFEYGAVHGIGQERSQGLGRYTLEVFEPL